VIEGALPPVLPHEYRARTLGPVKLLRQKFAATPRLTIFDCTPVRTMSFAITLVLQHAAPADVRSLPVSGAFNAITIIVDLRSEHDLKVLLKVGHADSATNMQDGLSRLTTGRRT
jgi:hypothetical protein